MILLLEIRTAVILFTVQCSVQCVDYRQWTVQWSGSVGVGWCGNHSFVGPTAKL